MIMIVLNRNFTYLQQNLKNKDLLRFNCFIFLRKISTIFFHLN